MANLLIYFIFFGLLIMYFCFFFYFLVQTDWFRFGYFILKTKTQPTGFGYVWFGFGLVQLFYIKNQKLYYFLGFCFFGLSNGFGFGWIWFFLGSVFLFFSVQLVFGLKLIKPNRTKYFLKYSNRFFSWFNFFIIIFLFSQFNQFFGFFAHP